MPLTIAGTGFLGTHFFIDPTQTGRHEKMHPNNVVRSRIKSSSRTWAQISDMTFNFFLYFEMKCKKRKLCWKSIIFSDKNQNRKIPLAGNVQNGVSFAVVGMLLLLLLYFQSLWLRAIWRAIFTRRPSRRRCSNGRYGSEGVTLTALVEAPTVWWPPGLPGGRPGSTWLPLESEAVGIGAARRMRSFVLDFVVHSLLFSDAFFLEIFSQSAPVALLALLLQWQQVSNTFAVASYM